jgi:hypothetical protein
MTTPVALLSGTVRMWWLAALWRVFDGAAEISPHGAETAPCVVAVVSDPHRRLTAFGGREGCARALGSMHACFVALFLGSSFRGRRTQRYHMDVRTEWTSIVSRRVVDEFIILMHAGGYCWPVTAAGASGETVSNCESCVVAPDGVVYVGGFDEAADGTTAVFTPQLARCWDDLPLAGLLAAGHTALATTSGFFRRSDAARLGAWCGLLWYNEPPRQVCFMPMCGHFAAMPKGNTNTVAVVDGNGSGCVLRHIALSVGVFESSCGIRCSAADELIVCTPDAALVICDADGVMRRRISYRFYDCFDVCGASIFAQLEYNHVEHEVHEALGPYCRFE